MERKYKAKAFDEKEYHSAVCVLYANARASEAIHDLSGLIHGVENQLFLHKELLRVIESILKADGSDGAKIIKIKNEIKCFKECIGCIERN